MTSNPTPRPAHPRLGRLLAWPLGLAVAVGMPLALAACGDDEEDDGGSGTAAVALTVAEGQGGGSEFTVPPSIEPGVNEITLTNEGAEGHSAQLLRTEGERTAEDVLGGLEAAMNGEAFPEWFYAGGGVGRVAPGETATVTQNLEPDSTYWVFDDGAGRPQVQELGTTGSGESGELEGTDNVVTAVDFDFEAGSLAAGEPITFENAGDEPHHMVAAPIEEGATIEDVEEYLETEEGRPPLAQGGQVETSVLEGGTGQVSAAALDSGRYALLCFISNREGGPPHVQLGMIEEVELE